MTRRPSRKLLAYLALTAAGSLAGLSFGRPELVALARATSRVQQYRELAFLWADRLTAGSRRNSEVLEATIGRMETEPYSVAPRFVASLAEQLQGDEAALARMQSWTEARLQQSLLAIVRTEHAREAQESVATALARQQCWRRGRPAPRCRQSPAPCRSG